MTLLYKLSCMIQNFHLLHVSNLSVRNCRFFLFMYPGSLTGLLFDRQAAAPPGLEPPVRPRVPWTTVVVACSACPIRTAAPAPPAGGGTSVKRVGSLVLHMRNDYLRYYNTKT